MDQVFEEKEERGRRGEPRALCVGNGEGACLLLEGVTKSFGGLTAVENVTLRVAPGERRAIIGPNGAGKTTLFNLIAGDLRPTSGRIFFQGEDVTRLSTHRRAHRGIARTYQITNLFFNLPVLDNLLIAVQGLERTKFSLFRSVFSYKHLYEKGLELLRLVGMEGIENELVRNLSYGIQRQIEVLLALTREPRLLLLDEPTAGLSPAEAAVMVEMLKKLSPRITMLVIEHDMDVAFDLAESVTVLHYGKILADGPAEEIKKDKTVQEIYLGLGKC
jgi:branched-chain amino acid transport system ATP-binding protein